eukprot:1151440-Pelagomonas_calceolata.AAC.8
MSTRGKKTGVIKAEQLSLPFLPFPSKAELTLHSWKPCCSGGIGRKVSKWEYPMGMGSAFQGKRSGVLTDHTAYPSCDTHSKSNRVLYLQGTALYIRTYEAAHPTVPHRHSL